MPSAFRELAARVPKSPAVKTQLCALAMTSVAASVARLVLLLNGVQPHAPDWVLIPAAFALGVATLHVGHCMEPNASE